MEAEVKTAKSDLNVLQAAHDAASSSAASAAQVDRDALVNAKVDFDAAVAEAKTLKAAQTAALDEATAKLREYEAKAAGAEALEKELARLNVDNANKISELEVEILELKESQEKADDEHGVFLARIKVLEGELAKAIAATQEAVDNATAKDSGHLQHVAEVKKAHDEELKTLSEEQAKVVAQLEALQKELEASQAAYQKAISEAQIATEDHALKLSEAEQLHLRKQADLAEQIKEVTTELEVR